MTEVASTCQVVDLDTAHELDRLATAITAIARELGRADIADRTGQLQQQLAHSAERDAVVVITGETSRGKSSVVNALACRPGLSPTGVDATTGAPVVVYHSAQESACAVLSVDGRAVRVPVDVQEVARLARIGSEGVACDTSPDGGAVVGRSPAWLEVGLPVEQLRGLRLIDTPGVGGLTNGHSQIVARTLTEADAVLLVVDAGTPISAGEVAFVRAAAELVDNVVVAVAKKDLHPDWSAMLAHDKQVLQGLGPVLGQARLLPVSPKLAERAAALATSGSSSPGLISLLASSGIEELRRALRDSVVERIGSLRVANTSRRLADEARGLSETAALRVVALSAPIERQQNLAEQVRAEQALLTDSSRLHLRRVAAKSLTRARLSRHDFDAAAREIRLRYRETAMTGPAKELEEVVDRMRAELAEAAAVVMAVDSNVVEAVEAAVAETLPGSRIADVFELNAAPAVRADVGSPLLSSSPGSRAASALALVGAASLGSSVIRMALLPLAGLGGVFVVLPWAAAALTATAGATLAWRRVRGQSEQQQRAAVAAWVDRAVADVTAEFARLFERQQLELSEALEHGVDELFVARRTELARLHADLQQAALGDTTTQLAAVQQCQQRLPQIATDAERLLVAARNARADAEPPTSQAVPAAQEGR